MQYEAFKAKISAARQAFSAGKVPAESDFNGLIAAVENAGFARGMIMMFSGKKDDIPEGWAWCDGTTKDVPDLRGRFIVGDTIEAAASRPGNDYGDGFNFDVGMLSVQSGTFSARLHGATDNTVLTEKHLPKHDHVESIAWTPFSYKKSKYTSFNDYRHIIGANQYQTRRVQHGESLAYLGIVEYDPRPLGEGGMYSECYNMHTSKSGVDAASHHHAISGEFDITLKSSNALTVAPPYFALAFIMKL